MRTGPRPKYDPVCIVDGCNKPHRSLGYCRSHEEMYRRYGTPTPPRPTVSERFWSRVDKSGDGCWLWPNLTPTGYGTFQWGGRRNMTTVSAHRFAYVDVIGPIPDGLELDHLCRNRGCVNPAHLEPVTRSQNIRRAIAARRLTAEKERG